MATTGHLFEEMMATYHSFGIAGKVAGKSSNTQWAFRQLWKKCGVEFHRLRPQQCVYPDILWHPHISATSAVCSGWTAMLSLPGVSRVSWWRLATHSRIWRPPIINQVLLEILRDRHPTPSGRSSSSGGNKVWNFTSRTR